MKNIKTNPIVKIYPVAGKPFYMEAKVKSKNTGKQVREVESFVSQNLKLVDHWEFVRKTDMPEFKTKLFFKDMTVYYKEEVPKGDQFAEVKLLCWISEYFHEIFYAIERKKEKKISNWFLIIGIIALFIGAILVKNTGYAPQGLLGVLWVFNKNEAIKISVVFMTGLICLIKGIKKLASEIF